MNRYMSLKDHVYDFISEKISNGTLTPTDKLSEQQICDELNISRTPVREALIQLAAEGYLESLPRRGFKVKYMDEQRAKDLYIIIGMLDGTAAALALKSITDKEINHMKYLTAAMDSAISNNSHDIYYKLQMEFHNEYTNLCGNIELINMLNQLKKNFIRHNYLIATTLDAEEILKSANREHKKIVELFEKGDSEGLQSYIKSVHWNIENAIFDAF
jgi:DNA-binding GntR family transcriptional regulator